MNNHPLYGYKTFSLPIILMSYVFKHFLDNYPEMVILGIVIEHEATIGAIKTTGSERDLGKMYNVQVHFSFPKNAKFKPTVDELGNQAIRVFNARYQNVDGISGQYDTRNGHMEVGYLLLHYPRDKLKEIKEKLPIIASQLSLSNDFKMDHRWDKAYDVLKIEVNGIESGLLFLGKVEEELKIKK